MALDRKYPHTATLWNKGPEVDRKATWEHHVLEGVRIEEGQGGRTTINGDQTIDTFLMLVPATLAHHTFAKDDRVAFGEHDKAAPVDDAHVITYCEPIRLRRGIHHLEVGGV